MADDSSKNIHTVNTDLETGTSSSLQQETHSTLPEEETRINTALNNYVSGTEAEKRLVRKVDFILLPMLWLMYVLAYIDRGNVVCIILRLPMSKLLINLICRPMQTLLGSVPTLIYRILVISTLRYQQPH